MRPVLYEIILLDAYDGLFKVTFTRPVIITNTERIHITKEAPWGEWQADCASAEAVDPNVDGFSQIYILKFNPVYGLGVDAPDKIPDTGIMRFLVTGPDEEIPFIEDANGTKLEAIHAAGGDNQAFLEYRKGPVQIMKTVLTDIEAQTFLVTFSDMVMIDDIERIHVTKQTPWGDWQANCSNAAPIDPNDGGYAKEWILTFGALYGLGMDPPESMPETGIIRFLVTGPTTDIPFVYNEDRVFLYGPEPAGGDNQAFIVYTYEASE